MEEAALVISIVALLLAVMLAGYGMLLQWMISKDTRQEIGNFKAEASGLLGEIRGLTTQTRERQERQFETMLGAVIERTTAMATTGTTDMIGRIDAIEARLREGLEPSDEVTLELGELRNTVYALRDQIPRVMQLARPAVGAEIASVHVIPSSTHPGGAVAITVECHFEPQPPWADFLVSCGVATPEDETFHVERAVPEEARLGARVGVELEFRYPRQFRGADCRARGEYLVVARLWWADRRLPPLDTAFSRFEVGMG